MIHKKTAKCSNGHTFEFGPCNKEVTNFFVFKSKCTSTKHDVLSRDQVQCLQCKTIHMSRECPQCGDYVPVEKFKLQTQFEKMMKAAR